jgi:hypothetical protein
MHARVQVHRIAHYSSAIDSGEKLMQYFRSGSWFLGDFLLLDDITLSSLTFTSTTKVKAWKISSSLHRTILTCSTEPSGSKELHPDDVGQVVSHLRMTAVEDLLL